MVDMEGRVVQTAETSYDGFYIISKIPTGKYYLRISQAQINKLNLESVSDESVEISSDNPFPTKNLLKFLHPNHFIAFFSGL